MAVVVISGTATYGQLIYTASADSTKCGFNISYELYGGRSDGSWWAYDVNGVIKVGSETVVDETASYSQGPCTEDTVTNSKYLICSGSFYVGTNYLGETSSDITITIDWRNSEWTTFRSGTGTIKAGTDLGNFSTWKVSYDANGGSGAPGSQTKYKFKDLTLSTTKPTKSSVSSTATGSFKITGQGNGGYFNGNINSTYIELSATSSTPQTTTYAFNHWNTSSDDTGTSYQSGGIFSKNTTTTLYAIYTSTTSPSGSTTYSNNKISNLQPSPIRDTVKNGSYNISFNANGGLCATNQLSSTRYIAYSFKGWGAKSTDTTPLASTVEYTSATTVYALWDSVSTADKITLPTPTRTGYTFIGWAESANAASGVTGQYQPTKSVTLYAIWSADGSVKIYDKANNQYKTALVWIYHNGVWRNTIPWAYKSGSWKICGG